jgi:hypothetical protein
VVYQSKQSVEAEARRQQELDAGLLSERFAQVKKVRLEVEFHDSTGARVQKRCRDLTPEAYAIFEMKCPLDTSPFDLGNVVARMVGERSKERTGEVKCAGSRSDNEHTINYRIEIEYQRSR